MFSTTGSNAPAIGAWNCSGSGIALSVGNVGASSYNVHVTANGVTTTPNTNVFNFGTHMQIDFSVQADQQYTIQVQSCMRYWLWSICSALSPTLHFTTAANSYCLNGYVWRQAFGGDYVCVTPSERSQAAYDNSQAIARIVAL